MYIHSGYASPLTSPRPLLQSNLWMSDSTASLSGYWTGQESVLNTPRKSAADFDHLEDSIDHDSELENGLSVTCLKHMIRLQSKLEEEQLRSEEIEWRFNTYREEQCKTLGRL